MSRKERRVKHKLHESFSSPFPGLKLSPGQHSYECLCGTKMITQDSIRVAKKKHLEAVKEVENE